ncbi:MAG: hypothetical protein ACTHMS_01575 [Jatrophihabitans sp.]|uniref:hypothetical protein n=1 Tax=Jatrophihabitans sp. TaxID=1932789 RepID=UPI003F800B96
MTSRRPLTLLLAAGLAALTACSSSGQRESPPTTASSTPSTATSSAPSPAELSAKVRQGVASVSTATLRVQATLLNQKVDGSGPATFANGQLTGVDLAGSIAGVGKVRVILSGGKAYAQVPTGLNTSGKPWLAVSADSKNLVASQLGGALSGIQGAASPTNLVTFIAAAKSLTDDGPAIIDGTATTHYTLVVDAAKLPAGFPGKDDYTTTLAGSATELWLDAQGRPVRVSRQAVVQGAKVPITITASAFGAPVTITAPPADQVATG